VVGLGVVSVLQAEAQVGLLFLNYHNYARSNKHKIKNLAFKSPRFT